MDTEYSTDFLRGWLRGFFDGEGGAYLQRYGKKNPTGYSRNMTSKVEAVNTDKSLIDFATAALDLLGIAYRLYERPPGPRGTKPHWTIRLNSRESVNQFAELVGFSSNEKASTLAAVVEWKNTPTGQKWKRDAQGKFAHL